MTDRKIKKTRSLIQQLHDVVENETAWLEKARLLSTHGCLRRLSQLVYLNSWITIKPRFAGKVSEFHNAYSQWFSELI